MSQNPMPKNDNGAVTHQTRPAEPQKNLPLQELLEARRGEKHLIVMHDFPDPDAISTAYTHKLISSAYDIETDIIYSGTISHQQNIALVRLLRITIQVFNPTLNLAGYQGAIFVDNQGSSASEIMEALVKANVPALIVVDHHELQELLSPTFSDIRRTGSTATIYAEYLQRGIINLDKSRQAHVYMATALMLGVLTDTGNLLNGRWEDYQAAAFLSQYTDVDLLRQVMTQSRSKKVMEIIRRALGDRTLIESYTIAGIGYLRAEDRDAIPQAADFLLTEENIHTAIVYGIVLYEDEEILIGSFRTSRLTVDPDEFIKATFGHDENGQYYGGGKSLAGAFKIGVGFLTGEVDEAYRQLKWEVFDRQMKHKIFAKLGISMSDNQSAEGR